MSLIYYFCNKKKQKNNTMKKESIITTTPAAKSNYHHIVSTTLQVMEDTTIVWDYKDNAKSILLEGSDVESIRIHIECGSEADNNSRIIRHVSLKDNHSQSMNISSIGREKSYKILKWLLKLVVVIKMYLNCKQFF